MKVYLAKRLVSINENLIKCCMVDVGGKVDVDKLFELLEMVIEEATELSLTMTKLGAMRLMSDHENLTPTNLAREVGEVITRFDDEIENLSFFRVNPDRLKYYNNPELAGTEFKDNFPKANAELIEAGNCLALIRHTACVFHLMRSVDVALTVFQASLGIAKPAAGPENTWGKTLGRIREKISENNKNPSPNWAANKEFYEQVYAFITVIKSPYRDPTVHVESVYDETAAESVFDVVVVALRHIATKLKEQ